MCCCRALKYATLMDFNSKMFFIVVAMETIDALSLKIISTNAVSRGLKHYIIFIYKLDHARKISSTYTNKDTLHSF